jgi:hypothetical protein
MNHTTRNRLAIAAIPVTAYVVSMALIAALWTKPPLLGWIDIGVLALVGAAIILGAFFLFPRSRTNVAPLPDGNRIDGILVLADTTCGRAELSDAIARSVQGRDLNVHVLAPIVLEPVDFLMGDEDAAREIAQQCLDDTLADLRAAGITATGSVGTDDPVQAVGDALAVFPVAELVIVTWKGSPWLDDAVGVRSLALVPSVDLIELERPDQSGAWSGLDESKLSPAERRFVHDDVEGHDMDAVIQGMFGGGNPERMLDFPPRR